MGLRCLIFYYKILCHERTGHSRPRRSRRCSKPQLFDPIMSRKSDTAPHQASSKPPRAIPTRTGALRGLVCERVKFHLWPACPLITSRRRRMQSTTERVRWGVAAHAKLGQARTPHFRALGCTLQLILSVAAYTYLRGGVFGCQHRRTAILLPIATEDALVFAARLKTKLTLLKHEKARRKWSKRRNASSERRTGWEGQRLTTKNYFLRRGLVVLRRREGTAT